MNAFVFNGDADGLLSQHLMALSGISPSIRITGLKREIALLERLPLFQSSLSEPFRIFVFDVSLDANRAGLMPLLEKAGIQVTWFDHHEAGAIPVSPHLETHIVNAPGICTALLVHAALPGSDPRWAAMAAFGDNLPQAGEALLRPLKLNDSEVTELREAGELLNYNAYGETGADVLFHPLEVAERLSSFQDPLEFICNSGCIEPLRLQFRDDVSHFQNLSPLEQRGSARIYQLPAKPWARRYAATFVNRLVLENPGAAFAILHPLRDGDFQVSIRSPRTQKGEALPASNLAREFPTGGGRALAAGINRLPASELPVFTMRFFKVYG